LQSAVAHYNWAITFLFSVPVMFFISAKVKKVPFYKKRAKTALQSQTPVDSVAFCTDGRFCIKAARHFLGAHHRKPIESEPGVFKHSSSVLPSHVSGLSDSLCDSHPAFSSAFGSESGSGLSKSGSLSRSTSGCASGSASGEPPLSDDLHIPRRDSVELRMAEEAKNKDSQQGSICRLAPSIAKSNVSGKKTTAQMRCAMMVYLQGIVVAHRHH
jgi:hypothetical protein